MKRLQLVVFVALTLFSYTTAWAQVFDLTADWSDLNNPNGAWALYKAPGQLFDISHPDWYGNGTNQPAWSDALGNDPFPPNPHVPMWAKAVGDIGILSGDPVYNGFVDAGNVFMHSAEAYRTGTDFSTLVWTSPRDGLVRIVGGLWISKAFDRPHTWELLKNGTMFTGGSLSQTDSYDKLNPFNLAAGSGGPSAMEFAVAAGDELTLQIYRPLFTLVPGTFVAVDLTIELVPEPGTALLAVAIALVLCGTRR